MSLSDELERLVALQQRGVLTEAEFLEAKARVLADPGRDSGSPALAAMNRLRRSRSDRWLGGVCAGLAQVLGLAPWLWRLMFVLLALCAGTGFMAYLLLWIFVPEEDAVPAAAANTLRPG
ncbi:MAG: PspC domain-containing protein [Burkholderiaceae bacterium]